MCCEIWKLLQAFDVWSTSVIWQCVNCSTGVLAAGSRCTPARYSPYCSIMHGTKYRNDHPPKNNSFISYIAQMSPTVADIKGVQGVQWTPGNDEKFTKSVLGHSLAINYRTCLYLYCFHRLWICFLTRPNALCLSAPAWLQVVQEHLKLNKYTKKRKNPVEPNYSAFKIATGFMLPVEHLGYVMRCLVGIPLNL